MKNVRKNETTVEFAGRLLRIFLIYAMMNVTALQNMACTPVQTAQVQKIEEAAASGETVVPGEIYTRIGEVQIGTNSEYVSNATIEISGSTAELPPEMAAKLTEMTNSLLSMLSNDPSTLPEELKEKIGTNQFSVLSGGNLPVVYDQGAGTTGQEDVVNQLLFDRIGPKVWNADLAPSTRASSILGLSIAPKKKLNVSASMLSTLGEDTGTNIDAATLTNLVETATAAAESNFRAEVMSNAEALQAECQSNVEEIINMSDDELFPPVCSIEAARQKDQALYEQKLARQAANPALKTEEMDYTLSQLSRNEFVTYLTNSARSGDILWNNEDWFGKAVLSGHAGVVYRKAQVTGKITNTNVVIFTTIDPTHSGNKDKAKVDYYSWDTHTLSPVSEAKILRTWSANFWGTRQSAYSESVGRSRVEKAYNKYHGRGYFLCWLKSCDGDRLYCSQVAWLTWHNDSGIDLDGSWMPQGLFFPALWAYSYVLTICVGWIWISWVVWIVVLIWILITIDMVQPWDIVIDNNTVEMARFKQ